MLVRGKISFGIFFLMSVAPFFVNDLWGAAGVGIVSGKNFAQLVIQHIFLKEELESDIKKLSQQKDEKWIQDFVRTLTSEILVKLDGWERAS
jgi:hypothetical protein